MRDPFDEPGRDLGDEPITVEGTVVPGAERFAAPVSGKDCAILDVLFVLEIADARSSFLVDVVEEQLALDFVLASGPHRVSVHAANAKLALRLRSDSGISDPVGERVVRFLEARGRWESETRRIFRVRYREGWIGPGDRIRVTGVATWEVDPETSAAAAGYRERALRLVLSEPDDEPLEIRKLR